jgi:hypothetical protein
MPEVRPIVPGSPQAAPRPAVPPPGSPPGSPRISTAPVVPPGSPKISTAPAPAAPAAKPSDNDPIKLVDEPAGQAHAPSKIRSMSSSGERAHVSHNWKRQTNVNGQGACRVRTFHGRLSEEGVEFLDNKINEWMDSHPEVEIKFVTTTIGTFEGKIRELALVMNVWY